MDVAKLVAKRSHCISHKVGCIIVKQGRIISTGYNGTPAGYVNCDQKWGYTYLLSTVVFDQNGNFTKQYLQRKQNHHQWSNIHEIHAQMNAILFAVKGGIDINNATIYSTLRPCQHCLKNMIQCGIKEIVYLEQYKNAKTSEQLLTFINTKIIFRQVK